MQLGVRYGHGPLWYRSLTAEEVEVVLGFEQAETELAARRRTEAEMRKLLAMGATVVTDGR